MDVMAFYLLPVSFQITTVFPHFILLSLENDDKQEAAGASKYKILIKCSVSEMKRLNNDVFTKMSLLLILLLLLPAACTSPTC